MFILLLSEPAKGSQYILKKPVFFSIPRWNKPQTKVSRIWLVYLSQSGALLRTGSFQVCKTARSLFRLQKHGYMSKALSGQVGLMDFTFLYWKVDIFLDRVLNCRHIYYFSSIWIILYSNLIINKPRNI